MKSNAYYLTKAIQKLRPNSEFVFYDDDYSTIEWHKLEGKAPTIADIESTIEQIKADEIAEEQARIEAKADLLSRLGINETEAKLLLS